MYHKRQQKILPYAPDDVFDLIMDVASYPRIFPMVKSARTLRPSPQGDEVELVFSLPPLLPIKDPVHVARVRGHKPDWISAVRIKGPLKAMDLRWDLQPTPRGETHLSVQMDYDLSFGFLVNALAQRQIDDLVTQAMDRFAAYAAQQLTPVNSPAGPAGPGGPQP
ncbi:MAG TPA: SRPBCC family protein [Micavibrio sp.]